MNFQEIITERLGMVLQVSNIIVVIILPVVITNVKGHLFSLGMQILDIIIFIKLKLSL